MNPNRYVIKVIDQLASIDAVQWDALVEAQEGAAPFMRHAYLLALHDSQSAQPHTGWQPQFLAFYDGDKLVGACPLYLKSHSYGEYVFDWAWADAYHQHGLAYYPKLLSSVPFTPVPGPRLLAQDPTAKHALLQGMIELAQRAHLSSAHVLFLNPDDAKIAREAGWLLRSGVQFHWQNRNPMPYQDFADFLSSLKRDKRKKITQERRKIQDMNIHFEVYEGEKISLEAWDFFYTCYQKTYQEHHATPYLTRDFFTRMAQTMPEHWLMFVAMQHDQRIAASLVAIDPHHGQAYGRYWGSVVDLPYVHFEACYYQPLSWCIAQQYTRFEGGAQGEHKMARGLAPVQTWSAHWLAHPQFSQAVSDFLAREGAGMQAYLDELKERQPFIHHIDL